MGVQGDIYVYEDSEVKNIGTPFNAKYMESEPYISPDGKTLFFESGRPGGSGGADIWLWGNSAGILQEPVNLGIPVNSEGDETQPFLTRDGKELYFTAVNREHIPSPAIFRSVRSGNAWCQPQMVATNFQGEPTFTYDERCLYFVHIFIMNGKLIDADIYSAEKKDQSDEA